MPSWYPNKDLASRLVLSTCGFVCAGAIALAGASQQTTTPSAQAEANSIAIDADDIGGVVTSMKGPEAGVWVIAETTELPTKFRKIVVTDDRGRFVIPDLPTAGYKVWVRGYGLIDSGAVPATPGTHLALTAVIAPDAKSAAQIYPANYWFSLMRVPPKDAFPMAPPDNAPQQEAIQTQAEWVSTIKGCNGICHQMGTKMTREVSPHMGTFDSTLAAWDYRIRMGQTGIGMLRSVSRLGRERSLSFFADWTDRIVAGEVPEAPPRPTGIERNLVIAMWDVGTPLTFMHDLYATDPRTPTVNGYGPIYGSDFNLNTLIILDPKRNTVRSVPLPFRDPDEIPHFSARTMEKPSLYFGDETIWDERSASHVKYVDAKNRAWIAYAWRARNKPPAFCQPGAANKFTKNFPLEGGNRQLSYYDPKTEKITQIDTCFGNRHAAFGEDQDETVYWGHNAAVSVIGWIKPRILDATGNVEAAQGWCPAYLDRNGNGKLDPAVDTMIPGPPYYLTYNPVDRSVWFAVDKTPGLIVRMEIGSNPPETCRTEAWEPPYYNPKAPDKLGYLPRGIDSDRNGLIWTGLAGSGHLASFDRSKCAVTRGADAFDYQRCPEGWTLYPVPGPQLKGYTDGGSADFLYGNWVDQFDALGLGKNVSMATGTGSDAMLALMPDTKKWIVMRVPYPLGFNARNLAGRIDDPNAGWKGRGLWVGNEVRNPWHIEGGKGTYPTAAHFQMRPAPLAK